MAVMTVPCRLYILQYIIFVGGFCVCVVVFFKFGRRSDFSSSCFNLSKKGSEEFKVLVEK